MPYGLAVRVTLQEEASFKLNLDGWGQHIRVLKNSRELALKLEPKRHPGQYWVGMPKEGWNQGLKSHELG